MSRRCFITEIVVQEQWDLKLSCASKREGEIEEVGSAKIYNGEDSKFHRYEDAWKLLEK